MKVSQYRLAKAIGVDARRIHAIVHAIVDHGRDGVANLSLLRNICRVLDGATEPVRTRVG